MTLDAIGQKLKAAREAQGLSLRQIYERTKIPINHLQAIDSGMQDDLPEPVYVAGFIKRYAECIGLDGQVLADEYRRDDLNGNGRPKTAVAAQQVYVTPEYLKHARIDNRPPTYKLWPFYVVLIVVLMVVLSWYSTQQTNTANQTDPNLLSLKDAAAQMGTPQAGINGATPSGPNGAITAQPPGSDDKVILSAAQHVWVEVKKLSTGESIFTGFLEQGDRREFQDSQGLRIRAGNGGSLSTEFKGKIEAFGEPGKASERTFSTAGSNAVASTDPNAAATGASSATSTATSTTVAVTKPKKVRKSEPSRYRSIDDGGARSIPDFSGGDGGTRSIDVPMRYSEGRLDAN